MSRFVSAEPGENALLKDAHRLVAQRSLIGMSDYGIFANGGNVIVSEDDFDANGIDAETPVCLLIQIAPTKDNPESSVPNFGEYVNVGRTIELLEEAPSIRQGCISMIEMEQNQIGVVVVPGAAANRVNNTPGVWDAADEAFLEAWDTAGDNA